MDKIFRLKIKEFRGKRGLTQEELAYLTGLSQGEISQLEKNVAKANPTLEVIYNLSQALQICPKQIITCNCPTCYMKIKRLEE